MAFDLARFVSAQDAVDADVRRELAAGRKSSHWMWFVFPQLRGLGRSATARHYGLQDAAEARAYLDHPVLGPRLRDMARRLLGVQGRSAHAIFGSPDDLKLRSCMTLFEAVGRTGQPAGDDAVFGDVLARYFDGARDDATLALLQAPGVAPGEG